MDKGTCMDHTDARSEPDEGRSKVPRVENAQVWCFMDIRRADLQAWPDVTGSGVKRASKKSW